MREIEARGKKTEDAIAAGCAELGVSREEVEVQIVQLPGLFRKAIVKLTVIGVEEPAADEKPRENKETKSDSEPRKPKRDREPRFEKKPAPVEKKPSVDTRPKVNVQREIKPVDPKAVELAEKYVSELLPLMGIEAGVEAEASEGEVRVTLDTDDASVIGYHGETLDAITVLAKRAAEKAGDKYVRVTVDAKGYRAHREESLVRLAEKTAEKCVRTGRKITLDPMSSDQRKIIHATLGENGKVFTKSEGKEPNRRVVVIPKRDGGNRGGKYGRPRAPRRDNAVAPATAAETPATVKADAPAEE